jgi:hypothetical protein
MKLQRWNVVLKSNFGVRDTKSESGMAEFVPGSVFTISHHLSTRRNIKACVRV